MEAHSSRNPGGVEAGPPPPPSPGCGRLVGGRSWRSGREPPFPRPAASLRCPSQWSWGVPLCAVAPTGSAAAA
eukprot:6451549-Alexandrium_andersonii.AAC.1